MIESLLYRGKDLIVNQLGKDRNEIRVENIFGTVPAQPLAKQRLDNRFPSHVYFIKVYDLNVF